MVDKFDYEFNALCLSYANSLPEKLETIAASFKILSSSWNSKTLLDFSSHVHKLTGSAGIYGYNEISTLSSQIETLLSQTGIDADANKDEILKQIEPLIERIGLCVKSEKLKINHPDIKCIDVKLIYLLNSNDDFSFGMEWSSELTKKMAIYGYTLVTVPSIEALLKELSGKRPLSIIVSYDLLFNPFEIEMNDESVRNMIQSYLKMCHTIFISKSGEFERRLNAYRMGCKDFMLLPFAVPDLISIVENLKSAWQDRYKAILLDDDPDVLKHNSKLLNDANIDNITLSSYSLLEKALHEFQPDIIILDLNMPDCSGIEIAAVIRQQKNYEHIPILYFSTENSKTVQLEAMSVGADDFITKSSDPDYLIQIIRLKAYRFRKFKSMSNIDNLTGTYTYHFMCAEIDKYIQLYRDASKSIVASVVSIANLDQVRKTYGYHAADQLLIGLSVLITNQLAPSHFVGRYIDDKLLIIFPDTPLIQAESEIKKIQDIFRGTLQYTDGKAYSSSFVAHFSTYQQNQSIEDFIQSADSDAVKI